jgi:hypothetical protein
MRTHWIEDPTTYDGSQLRAHWVLSRTGIVGDAAVGFRGPCRVRDDEMADLADLDGPGIAGEGLTEEQQKQERNGQQGAEHGEPFQQVFSRMRSDWWTLSGIQAFTRLVRTSGPGLHKLAPSPGQHSRAAAVSQPPRVPLDGAA